jgi:hypothetical protein
MPDSLVEFKRTITVTGKHRAWRKANKTPVAVLNQENIETILTLLSPQTDANNLQCSIGNHPPLT